MLRLANQHPPRINEMHHVCMQMQTRCIMLVPSLSTRQVAALLGRATTTITRAAGHTLYAYSEGRALRFPTWQFHDGRPIPGLAMLVPALREGLTPATIEARRTW